MTTAYEDLLSHARDTQALSAISGRLEWDRETVMPKGADRQRALLDLIGGDRLLVHNDHRFDRLRGRGGGHQKGQGHKGESQKPFHVFQIPSHCRLGQP